MTALRLFVYGSLKRGFGNHDRLAGAAFVAAARTAPRYRLVLAGAYPALTTGAIAVWGEIYEVSEELLARLDEFEGCPDLYQRREIELADQSRAAAYVMLSRSVRECPELPGGIWRER